jgi:hypothetical protein
MSSPSLIYLGVETPPFAKGGWEGFKIPLTPFFKGGTVWGSKIIFNKESTQ